MLFATAVFFCNSWLCVCVSVHVYVYVYVSRALYVFPATPDKATLPAKACCKLPSGNSSEQKQRAQAVCQSRKCGGLARKLRETHGLVFFAQCSCVEKWWFRSKVHLACYTCSDKACTPPQQTRDRLRLGGGLSQRKASIRVAENTYVAENTHPAAINSAFTHRRKKHRLLTQITRSPGVLAASLTCLSLFFVDAATASSLNSEDKARFSRKHF